MVVSALLNRCRTLVTTASSTIHDFQENLAACGWLASPAWHCLPSGERPAITSGTSNITSRKWITGKARDDLVTGIRILPSNNASAQETT
jgi:hypothetical protein